MSDGSVLQIDRDDDCWVFRLARPEKRNALSAELVEALLAGLDDAHRHDIPLLVFRGEGKNFSAGFDFTGYEDQSEGDLLLRFVRIEMLLEAIASSPSMTLGLCHGRSFGAGVDVFAACQRRVCAPQASFRMPGLKFGLVLGSRRFGELVGAGNALSILGQARAFDAEAAASMGFVQDVVQEQDWPQVIAQCREASQALSCDARTRLHRVLGGQSSNDDMAELVRSAAQPGLKQRIAQYLAG